MKLVFHVGWSKTVERLVRLLSRWTKVPPLPLRWHHPTGPHFGNTLALLTFDGREANVLIERAIDRAGAGQPADPDIVKVAELSMTRLPRQRPRH